MLADSSVWIDLFRERKTPEVPLLAAAMDKREVLVGDLVLCEVLRGCQTQKEFDRCRDVMLGYSLVYLCDTDLAIRAAANYRSLRSQGITVNSTIDALIATWCIEHDTWLLHSDRDFDRFEEHLGLKCVH